MIVVKKRSIGDVREFKIVQRETEYIMLNNRKVVTSEPTCCIHFFQLWCTLLNTVKCRFEIHAGGNKMYRTFCQFKIVKTQHNSTQLNATLKQLALELDTVVRCSTTHPPHPTQTFQTLLDQLESCNLAQTLTRPIWLTQHNFNPTNNWGGGYKPFPQD